MGKTVRPGRNRRRFTVRRILGRYYRRLLGAYGPQYWWPADGPFEMIVGTILTQNTAWKNVEKAIANLRQSGLLSPEALARVSSKRLANVIRPSGYFNIKADRLKRFARFLFEAYGGDLERMFEEPVELLRPRLLSVKGIGPETADSILLYAGRTPVFVIDAYTRRVLSRHRLASRTASYESLQSFFMDHLPPRTDLYNEYHALMVRVGKDYCRRRPLCRGCPLEPFLEGRRPKI